MYSIKENIPFIGGDTQSFYFDFGTKKASSVVECPMKIYRKTDVAIANPTNFISELNTQTDLDKLKSQDSTTYVLSSSAGTQYQHLMIELDLTPLATKLGLTNAQLKSALKSITVDTWAKGEGSNGGVLANGVELKLWYTDGSSWISRGSNTQNTIQKIPFASAGSADANKINSSNNLYVLLHSTYPSDGTIASKVELDYIRIRVDIARAADTVVNPPIIKVPNTWSMIIRGYAPNFASDNIKDNKRLFSLYKDASNECSLMWKSNKLSFLSKSAAGSVELQSAVQTFSKWQSISAIVEQTATGKRMRIFKNNGTVEKYTLNDTSHAITDMASLYPLSHPTGLQGDGFYEMINFKPGVNYEDDVVAEKILRGLESGYESPELVNNSWNGDEINIQVLPNNKYELSYNLVSNDISVDFLYNNIFIDSPIETNVPNDIAILCWDNDANTYKTQTGNIFSGIGNLIFTTPENCNYVKLVLSKDKAINETISLKMKA